jgi:hypothetical protein
MREKAEMIMDTASISNGIAEENPLLWRSDFRFMCCSCRDR